MKRMLGLSTLLVLLAGCGGSVATKEGDAAQQPPAVPEAVADALLPPMNIAVQRAEEKRFDVNVDGAPAPAFFMSLVDGTPYNMVVNPQVSGRISLNLKGVTVPEVMDMVRDAYGYDYRRKGNGYTVYPAGIQTRVFQVNYLNVKRTGRSRTRVSSGQITDFQGGGGTTPSLPEGATGQTTTLAGSNVDTASESDFWRDLEASLKLLVPVRENRSIMLNPEAGLIVVRAQPAELREVANFLESMQASIDRQVILETKILEVQLSDSFQAGINWGALGTRSNGDTVFGGQVGGQNAIDSGTSAIANTGLTITPGTSTPFTGFNSTAIGGAFVLALNFADFNAVIEALETQGDVQVLSSPRISTVNNQKAIIKVGSDEFFVTGVRSNTTTGTATTTNRDIQLTPFFSGIALDVTPQIASHGEVILHVHPTVSEVRDQIKNLVVSGQAETLPLALSNVRESDSIVRARSGQVVVIGGLMQNTTKDEYFGIPVLSRIPLLGYLFRQTRQSTKKSELVILLKPQVAEAAQTVEHGDGAPEDARQVWSRQSLKPPKD